MELTLLRHGVPVDPAFWSEGDSSRPLTPQGLAQAQAVIEALHSSGRLQCDEIWSSPYVRTARTAEIAATALGLQPKIVPALASGATLLKTLPAAAPRAWPEHLLCVGHQPDLGDLIADLLGDPHGHYGLGRSGVARLTGEFAAGGMRLEWLLTAEEVLRAPFQPL